MGLKELFTDPATRPKAVAASLLLGGALAFGAYAFWQQRATVARGLAQAVRKAEHAVKDAAHTVEDQLLAQSPTYAAKLKPAKDRVHEFKLMHLQPFVEVKEAAIKLKDAPVLDLATLKRIQLIAIEMAEKDFRKIIKVNREQRRKCIEHDKPRYEEIFIKGETEFEEVFNQNLKEILADMGVPQEKYEDSIEAHVQEDQEIYLVGAALYDVMIGRLPAFVDHLNPTKEKVVEIYNFMIEHYKSTFYKPVHKEFFTDIKEKMVLDRVYEKYEIEEEGLRKLRNTFDSLELAELQEKFSNLISKDEQEFGNFPETK